MQYNAFTILVCNSFKKEVKTLPPTALRESTVRIRGSFHIYGGCFFLLSYIFLGPLGRSPMLVMMCLYELCGVSKQNEIMVRTKTETNQMRPKKKI